MTQAPFAILGVFLVMVVVVIFMPKGFFSLYQGFRAKGKGSWKSIGPVLLENIRRYRV